MVWSIEAIAGRFLWRFPRRSTDPHGCIRRNAHHRDFKRLPIGDRDLVALTFDLFGFDCAHEVTDRHVTDYTVHNIGPDFGSLGGTAEPQNGTAAAIAVDRRRLDHTDLDVWVVVPEHGRAVAQARVRHCPRRVVENFIAEPTCDWLLRAERHLNGARLFIDRAHSRLPAQRCPAAVGVDLLHGHGPGQSCTDQRSGQAAIRRQEFHFCHRTRPLLDLRRHLAAEQRQAPRPEPRP